MVRSLTLSSLAALALLAFVALSSVAGMPVKSPPSRPAAPQTTSHALTKFLVPRNAEERVVATAPGAAIYPMGQRRTQSDHKAGMSASGGCKSTRLKLERVQFIHSCSSLLNCALSAGGNVWPIAIYYVCKHCD